MKILALALLLLSNAAFADCKSTLSTAMSSNTQAAYPSVTISDTKGYTAQAQAICDNAGLVGGPTGMVIAFVGTTCPTGYVAADGGTISNATYPALATVLGDTYGTHSGANYYTPNLKGVFLRGAGTQGIHVGTQSGTLQEDQFQGHIHNTYYGSANYTNGAGWGNLSGNESKPNLVPNQSPVRESVTDGSNGTVRYGNETRPANITVLYCVKT